MITLLAAPRIAAASSAVALRTGRASCAAAPAICFLSERAEEHVGERAIHGFGHVHGEDEAGGAVERAGDDQQFAIEHEAHGCGGKPGVGIQQRNHRGHIGAADGDDHQHAEDQWNYEHQREEMHVAGIVHEVCGDANRDCQQREVDDILTFIGDGALRQDFLKFSGGHQAAGERESAQNYLHREHGHHEGRDVGRAQVEFGGSDQRDAECAEGVAERGSLRHGGHLHHAERHADDGAEDQCDGDPFVFNNVVIEQRAADGEQHADFAGAHAAAGGGGRAHPLQRHDEERRGDQVDDFDEGVGSDPGGHYFFGPLDLNILSMRSVMRKPPTTLLVAATMASVPRTVERVLRCSPVRMMAPTTAIASSALVSDISGVCSSGEIWRMTSKPMKAASMKT